MHAIRSYCAPRWLLTLALAGCTSAPTVTPPATPTTTATATTTSPPAPPVQQAAATPAATPTPTLDIKPEDFASWVTAFRIRARAAGISEATLAAAFDGIQLLPRVIELDRSQPELTRAVWDYLDSAVSPARVTRGQAKLQELRTVADAAAVRYGVPSSILTAVWGLESNYGSNYGDISTIAALATLGFEGRRGEWARGQLLAALRILQNGDIDRAHMVGSWAGAMGQTQFLPSVFLAYAVDGDGDGKRDIWGSMADVFASTANFIARSGWQSDQAWGAEVRLPAGFDVERADMAVRQSAAQWAAEGVQMVQGAPLPELGEASILLPAGARGPAFIVGRNFRTILRYNNATSYALAVCLLAQRLENGPGVQAAWPRDLQMLTRSQLQALQTALNARGFATGTPDGIMGPATRDGVRRYQRSINVPADGYPTLDLLQGLQAP